MLMIPEEDTVEGDHARCAKLNASLYGTLDAQRNWENKYFHSAVPTRE